MMRWLVVLAISLSASARAATEVDVAVYEFPPYYSMHFEQHVVGELVKVLNDYQNQYSFRLKVIPPNWRYRALSATGCCDVIFFEAYEWGWKQRHIDVEQTVPLIKSHNRFVTLKTPQREQDFFAHKQGKRIGGMAGYVYNFTDGETDVQYLEKHYNMYLSDSQITNLRLLRNRRLDFAIINEELLATLANSDSDYGDNILMSEKQDGEYLLRILVGANKAITAATMQQLLREVGSTGEIDRIIRQFNLERYQIYRPRVYR
ncbi:transporter substrate-binding domain-containing protein [Idiomarina xiamenensis]|nr:transporter substrate-binding domain-containing protein [Idiomarina xiamenensis]